MCASLWSWPHGARLITAVLMLVLGLAKFTTSWNTAHLSDADGGYYTNVAQHVRDGDGLETRVSLYHKAYSYFPHPTAVQPLWPLVLGYGARVFEMDRLGVWLPTALWGLALLFGYLWALRRYPGPLFSRLPWLNAGHVLVVMLGTNREFFRFTSRPYTEGLALALLLAALWRFERLWTRPSWKSGLEMGAWLGLLMLTRSQLLTGAMAAAVVFGVALALVSERRRDYAVMAVTCALAFVALIAPHYLYITSFAENSTLASLVRFDQVRESSILGSIESLVQTDGVWAYLLDRGRGLWVAFSWGTSYSYSLQFWTFQYAAIAALPFALWACVGPGWRGRADALLARVRDGSALPWLFVLVFALGNFVLIHTLHKNLWNPWNFARRQAIVCIFLFFIALMFLLRRQRWPATALALVVMLSGTYVGATYVESKTVGTIRRPPGDYRPEMVRWLEDEAARRGGEMTIALHSSPQIFSSLTRNVNYHWIYLGTTLQDLDVMVRDLGIVYLVTSPKLRGARFARDPLAFNRRWTRVGRVLSYEIYAPIRLRRPPGGTAGPRR